MSQIGKEIFGCRQCRTGPKSNRIGWTDEDMDAMWIVTPGESVYAMTLGGMAIPLSLEVVPCEPHRLALEQQEVNV